jgi:twitching motility two-component system response regulator PilG
MSQLVMVIDDSLVVRTILDTCLRRSGYQVMSFADGLQALGWLNTREARIPDLIFVDLGLPRLDGYEIIRLLKARPALENTVLVILTARDGILDRVKGHLVGAHAYLTKPFRTQTILEAVQMHIGGANWCDVIETLPPNKLAAPVWGQAEDQRRERGTRPC